MIEAVELWRYEAPEGVWHWVMRDPVAIKRPGQRMLAFPADEAEAMLARHAETEEHDERSDPS